MGRRGIALLDRRLVYVSGKGGVGKSTVAAALGLAAVRRGRRTVVAEVHRRTDVEHEVTAAGADHVSIDPEDAMEEYLADQLPVLAAPRTFATAARVGPIARQGGIIDAMFSDPQRIAVVAVTTPEELPVNETLALRESLREQIGLDLALVVVNSVRPDRFTGAEVERLRTVDGAAGRLARAAHGHARSQRAQIGRLRRGLRGEVPTVSVPFNPAGADVDTIADRLERAL